MNNDYNSINRLNTVGTPQCIKKMSRSHNPKHTPMIHLVHQTRSSQFIHNPFSFQSIPTNRIKFSNQFLNYKKIDGSIVDSKDEFGGLFETYRNCSSNKSRDCKTTSTVNDGEMAHNSTFTEATLKFNKAELAHLNTCQLPFKTNTENEEEMLMEIKLYNALTDEIECNLKLMSKLKCIQEKELNSRLIVLPQCKFKNTLILDLDETLIHSILGQTTNSYYKNSVIHRITYYSKAIDLMLKVQYVERPFLVNFLREASKKFELIVR